MRNYSDAEHVNVGCGKDYTILEVAELIAKTVGYTGRITTDLSKPDGTPQKLLDVSKLNKLGWQASTSLKKGLEKTYAWYLNS